MSIPKNLREQLAGRLRGRSARAFISSMGAAITARFAALALAILLARELGPEQYGVFTFSVGVATLAGQISALGWPTLMNRLIPGFMRDSDWPRLKGLRDGGDLVVGCSSLTAALLFFGAGMGGFLRPDIANGLALAALLVVPFAFIVLRRQQMAAVRRPAIGLLFDQGFGAGLLVLIILLGGSRSPAEAIVLLAATTSVGILVTTIMFRRSLPADLARARGHIELGAWMMIALPMTLGLTSKLLMNRADILMLAPLSNMTEVGLYGAAFRLTYLLSFPQVVLMTVVTPLFSQSFTNGNPKAVARLLKGAMLFAAVTTVPFAVALMLFPSWIMEIIYGPKFTAAGPTLAMLALSQLAASLAIPFSAMLTMGARERAYGGLSLAALAINIVLNLILIPRHGALGAAMASAASSILLFGSQLLLIPPLLRARPGPDPRTS